MSRRASLPPALLEMIVAVLFLALSTSVVVRLAAAANEASVKSALESRALLLMESALEDAKADPAGEWDFSAGARAYTVESEDGIQIRIEITRTQTAAGALYDIAAAASKDAAPLGTLAGARYISGEETP